MSPREPGEASYPAATNNLVNAECITSLDVFQKHRLNTNLAWGERRAQDSRRGVWYRSTGGARGGR